MQEVGRGKKSSREFPETPDLKVQSVIAKAFITLVGSGGYGKVQLDSNMKIYICSNGGESRQKLMGLGTCSERGLRH